MTLENGQGLVTEVTVEEWNKRKAFANFTDEDAELLSELRPIAEEYSDEIIEELYERFLMFEETRSFFPDEATLDRVKGLQKDYFLGLTKGEYGEDYLKGRLQIGRTHQRIGLEPRWYMGASSIYAQLVFTKIMQSFRSDPEKGHRVFLAMLKVIKLDEELAITTYLSTREEEIKRLALALETVTDGAVIAGYDGRIQYANPAAYKMFDYEPSELLGLPIWELHSKSSRGKEVPEIFEASLKGDWTGELLGRKKKGEKLPIRLSTAPMRDENGQPTGIVGIITDITERKQAEEEIKGALQEKEVLLREIHHRVKNNLQVIVSLLNLQSRQFKDEKIRLMCVDTQNRVRAMAQIHELLYQAKDMTSIDMRQYIKQMVTQL